MCSKHNRISIQGIKLHFCFKRNEPKYLVTKNFDSSTKNFDSSTGKKKNYVMSRDIWGQCKGWWSSKGSWRASPEACVHCWVSESMAQAEDRLQYLVYLFSHKCSSVTGHKNLLFIASTQTLTCHVCCEKTTQVSDSFNRKLCFSYQYSGASSFLTRKLFHKQTAKIKG